jgi:hypothetical protein
MMRWKKTALWAGLLLIVLGLCGAILRTMVLSKAERALRERGFTWESTEAGLTQAQWHGLSAPGVKVDLLEASIWPDATARIVGMQLDTEQLIEWSETDPITVQTGLTEPIEFWGIEPRIEAEGVDIYHGAQLLLRGLSGSLSGTLMLSAGDQLLTRAGQQWTIRRPYPVDLPELKGTSLVELSCSQGCALRLTMSDAVFEVGVLSSEPLPPTALELIGNVDLSSQLVDGTLRVGELETQLVIQLQDAPARYRVDYQTEEIPLTAIVALFGDTLPEKFHRARPEGTIRVEGWIDGDGGWALEPSATELSCRGLLTDLGGMRHGEVVWTARDASGADEPRHTGPDVPGFTPFADAGYLPEAIIAAEDTAFYEHPGYSMVAIRAALKRMKDEPESGLRGGSTLTQQLAKNLYLDGSERTLRRKFEELLYTLELERVLSKRQILQLYINVVEFGPGTWGASPAAEVMFMKKPGRLTLKEAAYLASVLPSPVRAWERYYLRNRTPTARIDYILQNMVDGRSLRSVEAQRARQQELRFVPQ